MKSAWINSILHISSVIQKAKQKLPVSHAIGSISLLIIIIFYEILLTIISLPLYLVRKDLGNSAGEIKAYRTRRIITLTMLVIITVIWLLKLSLVGISFRLFSDSSLSSLKKTGVESAQPLEISQEQIFDLQQGSISTEISSPTIDQAVTRQDGSIEFTGTAQPLSSIFIYLTKTGDENSSLTIISTKTDETGLWRVIPDKEQLEFLRGNYTARAVAFDPEKQIYSSPGDGVSFTLNNDARSLTSFLRQADTILNISLIVFVFLGVITTILLT